MAIRLAMALLALAVSMVLAGGAARAGDKGGIAFILDHGKELNLNDEQKRALNNLRTVEERTRNKILAEPDMKVLIHKAIQAKLKNDDAGATAAFTELITKVLEKAAPVAKGMMEELGKLLTPDQIAKIQDLKDAQDGKAKPAKEDDRNKPKRGTAPPNPFEF